MFLGTLFKKKKKKEERQKFLPVSLESCYYETESTAAICKSSTWRGVSGSEAAGDMVDFKGHEKLSSGFWSSAQIEIMSFLSCFIRNTSYFMMIKSKCGTTGATLARLT